MTPWTVAHQAFLSMEFSRQVYWGAKPFPHPGDLSDPGIESISHVSPVMGGGFFTTGPQQQSQIAMPILLEEFHKMIILLEKTLDCAVNNIQENLISPLFLSSNVSMMN